MKGFEPIKFKYSIKSKYALIFGWLLVGAITLFCVVNALLMERVYLNDKKSVLVASYAKIDRSLSENDFNSEDFDRDFERISSMNNINMLVMDADTQEVKASGHDSKAMTRKLLSYVFDSMDEEVTLLDSGNRYSLLMTPDRRIGMNYLELWGMLSTGDFIVMQTPVESIRESAGVANRLIVTIGSCVVIFGIITIFIVSCKITKPIMNLVRISEKMTHLDFTEKYSGGKHGKGNEVDLLGSHINQLSSALEKTISELKTANVELERDIEERKEIDEMRTEFISNVSHELKTPIALVQGYAEGLKDCVNDDNESREFYCDVIIDEANRMNKLVKNLLTLNELETGHNNIEVEHFDIIILINNCADSMRLFCKQNGITLKLPSAESMYVWADELKVEQVFNNYLSNAIHYAAGAKEVSVDVKKTGDILRVSVFNTGNNIPEESMELIWTKFYKVDKARTREYGGNGIGLSIVKAIMDSMGHAYGVQNHEHGVEFWFEVDATDKL